MIVFLKTDILIYIVFVGLIIGLLRAKNNQFFCNAWRSVFNNRLALISFIILSTYIIVGLLDSIHFRDSTNRHQISSLLDKILMPIGQNDEKTFSRPFSLYLLSLESVRYQDGTIKRIYPRLRYGGRSLDNENDRLIDIFERVVLSTIVSMVIFLFAFSVINTWQSKKNKQQWWETAKQILFDKTVFHWRCLLITASILSWLLITCLVLSAEYHILGTDKIGQDVFYQTIKSIRTGLAIGTLSTLFMLPIAISLGICAGYFGKRIDDIIQYIYTVLSSVPSVLLLAAAILSLQVYTANHRVQISGLAEQADLRLLSLCLVLGLTGWVGLCRIIRAETFKLRELEYVQAAHVFGLSHLSIMWRHILPNIFHLVLIAVVIDFSYLILTEAVLTYLSLGVSPSMNSWGNMINTARLEMAREPVVWWPLFSAFLFMFVLILAANLFSDALRDAFDPRTRDRLL